MDRYFAIITNHFSNVLLTDTSQSVPIGLSHYLSWEQLEFLQLHPLSHQPEGPSLEHSEVLFFDTDFDLHVYSKQKASNRNLWVGSTKVSNL